MTRLPVVTCLLCLFLGSGVARAEGGELDEAKGLRDRSSVDWKEGRHADAAAKLRRAAEIYRRAKGDHNGDIAVVLRALVWNLVKAGKVDEARTVFDELLQLVHDVAGYESDMWSAYSAMYEGADARSDLDEAVAVLMACREGALERDLHKVAAQVLHDCGSFSRKRGAPERAVEYYNSAIKERDAITDRVGKTWSLNNLANMYLGADRLDDALPPLLDAYRMVHDERVVPPQAAVAINLRTALDALRKQSPPTAAQREWLWAVAETGARSDMPEIVPSDSLLRRAAQAENASGEKGAGLDAARRMMRLRVVGQPPEVVADLTLFAANLARETGGAKDAGKWLAKVDVGKGPCAPHLTARLDLARALAAAARKQKSAFAKKAVKAAEAWRDLGDREGREAALEALVGKARALGVEVAAELQPEHDELRRAGQPGNLGSSASGGGDRSGYQDMELQDRLFEIGVEDGNVIRLRDVLTDRHMDFDIAWQPRNVGLNGLSITFFGGWVKINSLSYGGAAAAGGSPSTTSLEKLETYVPVPGKGKLVVLKNGAVTWRDD